MVKHTCNDSFMIELGTLCQINVHFHLSSSAWCWNSTLVALLFLLQPLPAWPPLSSLINTKHSRQDEVKIGQSIWENYQVSHETVITGMFHHHIGFSVRISNKLMWPYNPDEFNCDERVWRFEPPCILTESYKPLTSLFTLCYWRMYKNLKLKL